MVYIFHGNGCVFNDVRIAVWMINVVRFYSYMLRKNGISMF